MPSCPHCGAVVDGDATRCTQCGGSVTGPPVDSGGRGWDSRPGQQRAGQQRGNEERGDDGAGQEVPRHDRVGVHPTRDPYWEEPHRDGIGGQSTVQDHQRSARPQPTERAPASGPEGESDRRTLLKAGAVGIVLAAGGLFATQYLGGTGGPAETARAFVTALDAGDVDRANALLHEDAPRGDLDRVSVSAMESTDNTIDETSVVERTETYTVVEVNVSRGSGDATVSEQVTVRLRQTDGQWRVWSYD